MNTDIDIAFTCTDILLQYFSVAFQAYFLFVYISVNIINIQIIFVTELYFCIVMYHFNYCSVF